MKFAVTAPLLSLCLPLMLGIGGCASYLDFHEKRLGKLIADTTAKLGRNPNNAEFYVARGRAYYCTRQFQKALSDFKRAIDIDPKNARAYRGRGSASKMVDYQALAVKVAPYHHKGYEADTRKADLLDPKLLDEEINQGFGYVSNVTKEFIYPIAGDCIKKSTLVLGSTTKTQAAEMLPPNRFNSLGARAFTGKGTKPRIGKVGNVVDNVKSIYHTNSFTAPQLSLIFDKNDKLVVIRDVVTMKFDKSWTERIRHTSRKRQEKYRDLMRQYQFTEAYRDTKLDIIMMRAEITPCVTADIGIPVRPNKYNFVIYVVEYIYVCSTN